MLNNIYLTLKLIQDTISPLSKETEEKIFKSYVNCVFENKPLNLEKTKKNYFIGADQVTLKIENITLTGSSR